MLAIAFDKKWFYIGALVLAVLYGFGGLVHIGNILGFGELEWSDAPLSWKVGDIGWGTLDMIAVIGIVLKSPIGLVALALAALSQVVVSGLLPELFALTETHHSTLRYLVYFNGLVLFTLSVGFHLATMKKGN